MSESESTHAVAGRSNERLKGILFLCFGVAIFTLQDVAFKWLSDKYPLTELLAFRCVVAFGPLLILLHFDGGLAGIRRGRRGWMVMRSLCLFLAYATYYSALAALPLGEALTLFYSAPLFIVALSGPLLHERVGLGRWLAVLFGFAGVVVVYQPGDTAFNPAALVAVGSAAFYAVGQLMSRWLGATARASTMAIYHNTINLAAALVIGIVGGDGAFAESSHPSVQFLLRAWSWPESPDLLIIAATGVVAALGGWALTSAYRIAEVNVVAPFEYTSIAWGILAGFLIWNEEPSLTMIVGVAIIVAAGVYVTRTSRRVR